MKIDSGRRTGAQRALAGVVASLLVAVLGSLLTVLSPAGASAANQVDPDQHLGDSAGARSATFMVGDSITYGGYRVLGPRHPDWEITAFPGRTIDTLPSYLSGRVANPSPLDTVVIALGTNAVASWTYADLVEAVRLLPATTKVVLVTTFRQASERYPASTYRYRPGVQRRYSTWMYQLADTRPHTCVASWRTYAKKHVRLLSDGVHPKPPARRAWASLIDSTVTRCS